MIKKLPIIDPLIAFFSRNQDSPFVIYVVPFFSFDLFLKARAEILKKIRWFYGRNDDTQKTF